MIDSNSKIKILFIDDEFIVRQTYREILLYNGFDVETACSGAEGLDKIQPTKNHFDVVVTDLVMDPIGGMEVLEKTMTIDPDSAVILMTGYATIESAIDAIRKGAYDYLLKPFQPTNFLLTIQRAAEKRRLLMENRRLINDLQTKNMDLSSALRQLNDAHALIIENERKNTFIKTVISLRHEINNPLTTIIAKLQLIQENPLLSHITALKESIDIILKQSERISELMQKLDQIEPNSVVYVDNIDMIEVNHSANPAC